MSQHVERAQNQFFDGFFRVIAISGQSIPVFWLGLMLMLLFGVILGILPTGGSGGPSHLILPAITLGWYVAAGVMRLTRTSMLEVLRLDYIKTARSKGLPESVVLYRHAFRNAVLPIVTILGLSVPGLLGGSVIFETIFSIPGMGKLMYDSVMARDINVYMAILVISAVLTLLGNLLADLAYRWVDPRIRYE